MTTYSTKIRTSSTIRFCGQLCLLAGVLGAASSVYLAFYSPAVPEDMWSYPQTPEAFAGTQVWLTVQHLGLLAGLFALWWSGALPPSITARQADAAMPPRCSPSRPA